MSTDVFFKTCFFKWVLAKIELQRVAVQEFVQPIPYSWTGTSLFLSWMYNRVVSFEQDDVLLIAETWDQH